MDTKQLVSTSYGTYLMPTGEEYIRDDRDNYVQISRTTAQGDQSHSQSGSVSFPVINVAANIGTLEEFKANTNWSIYRERLEQYFHANFVDDTRKVPVLLTAIGTEVYQILRDLCDPQLPQDKAYKELCDILTRHFSPQISVFKERRKFWELRQDRNESISLWYARIKKGAVQCSFGATLEDKLKEKFISGMAEGKILDRICEEKHQSSLSELIDVALKKEASLAVTTGPTSADLNRISQYKRTNQNVPLKSSESPKLSTKVGGQQQRSTQQHQQAKTCIHCGGTNHVFARCKYRKYKCKNCNKIGHLVKVCKEPDKSNQANYVAADDLSAKIEYATLYNVESKRNFDLKDTDFPPVIVDVCVGGTMIPMEIDSGAKLNVMPLDVFNKYLPNVKINKSMRILKCYNNSTLKPVGEVEIDVKYKNKKVMATIVIVKENRRVSLLGRDLMKKLGFTIAGIDKVDSENDLEKVLNKFSDLFDGKLGKYTGKKIHINVKENVKPVFRKPHTIPFAMKEGVEKELDRLEKEGIIEKATVSEWGTPLVPVLKQNGGIRVCANYKLTVNNYIENHNYPIPRIEEIFVALQGGEKFTVLDLSRAYNQIELDEETKKLLAWSTHKGVYFMNRLSFGSKPACALFQEIVETVLRGISGCKNYIDDIIVTGKDKKEHLKNLELVLSRLKENGLKLNLEKCKFLQDKVGYLGFIIDKTGLHKNPEKVKPLEYLRAPRNVTEVQAIAGMVNYYARFIPNISTLLSPIYDLLQKNKKFLWSKECEDALDSIKKEILSDRYLVHFDPKIPIKLACDASNVGIGAVLLHVFPNGEEKPICFASRTLNKAEKNYSVIHREALAIYWATQKFYQYLKGTKFILQSDHKPLLAIFGENKGIPQMAAGRLQRWAYFLSGFDYELQYVKGIHNGGADGLSRLPLEQETAELEVESDYFSFLIEEKLPVDSKQLRQATRVDPEISKVFSYVRNGWPDTVEEKLRPYFIRSTELSIDQGLLLWGYRVIVPQKYRLDLLKEVHSTHLGSSKMKSLARQYFWWPNLDKDLENFAKSCDVCNTLASNPKKAVLIKFDQTKEPLERIHGDFLGPVKGKYYLIFTDAYSKWPEVYPMNRIDSANTVNKLRDYCSRYGIPKKIISDNGRQLISDEFEYFCKTNGILHITSAAYYPASNGAAENAVKSFKSGLYKALTDPKNSKTDIETLISRYLFGYRVTPHTITGESPAKRMIGRELRTRFDLLKENSTFEQKIEKQIQNYAGNREISFDYGDIVWVKDYRNVNKPIWVKAEVYECLGRRNYICKLINEKLCWKRHVNQMRKAENFFNEEVKIDFDSQKEIVSSEILKEMENNVKEKSEFDNKSKVIENYKNAEITMPCVPEITIPDSKEKCKIFSENTYENKCETSSSEAYSNKSSQEEKSSRVVENVRIEEIKNRPTESASILSGRKSVERAEKIVEPVAKQKLNVNERPKRTIKKPNRLNL